MAPTITELVAAVRADHPDLAVVGIDIPIGLPDTAPRQADLLARQRLPVGRKSSVFPAPTRVATAATTHVEASAANREATGVGLSIQAFRLVPKILEVDAYVRSPRSCRIVEVHPEVSFAAMDAGSVVPAKRTAAGIESRRAGAARRRHRAAVVRPRAGVRRRRPPRRLRRGLDGRPGGHAETPRPSPTPRRPSPTPSPPRSGSEGIVRDDSVVGTGLSAAKLVADYPGDARFGEGARGPERIGP